MKALYEKRKMFRNYSEEMFSNLRVFGDEMLEEHMEMSYVSNTHIISLLLHFLKHVTTVVPISFLAIFKQEIQYSLWWVGI